MKLKKAKDNSNQIAVFMISEFGEAYTNISAGTFVTVPQKGLYELLHEDVGDLKRFIEMDEFLQEGLRAGWFTTKIHADEVFDYVCNVQNQYKECELKYIILPVEVLYMNLKTKKAHDSTVANLLLENNGVYLINYNTKTVANKTFIFDLKWSKDKDQAVLFDNEAARWTKDLIKANFKNSSLVKITEYEAEPVEDVEMFVAVLQQNRSKKYLYVEDGIYNSVDDPAEATWYTEEEYYRFWSTGKQDQLLKTLASNQGINLVSLEADSLGLFDEDFVRYRKTGADTKNKAQLKWEAEHGA